MTGNGWAAITAFPVTPIPPIILSWLLYAAIAAI